MCGRYGRLQGDSDLDAIARQYDAIVLATLKSNADEFKRRENRERWRDSYNITPGTNQLIVIEKDGERVLTSGKWGWSRPWKRGDLVNAKGEEIPLKRTWLPAMAEGRRCVIPASMFFEWTDPGREPWCYAMKGREPFGIGGLWEETADGIAFVLLTAIPNDLCSLVHTRMPLILDREEQLRWTTAKTDIHGSMDLVKTYPADRMTTWRISKLIDQKREDRRFWDGPEIIEEYDPAKHDAMVASAKAIAKAKKGS